MSVFQLWWPQRVKRWIKGRTRGYLVTGVMRSDDGYSMGVMAGSGRCFLVAGLYSRQQALAVNSLLLPPLTVPYHGSRGSSQEGNHCWLSQTSLELLIHCREDRNDIERERVCVPLGTTTTWYSRVTHR